MSKWCDSLRAGMNTSGWRRSARASEVVPDFWAPMMMKSGRMGTTSRSVTSTVLLDIESFYATTGEEPIVGRSQIRSRRE